MAIGLSHGGSTIYSSTSPSSQVLVGTKEGIVVLERDGKTWRIADSVLTDRHISAIITEPESGLIFAGAFKGSLHVSADGGKTWKDYTNLYVDCHRCIVDHRLHPSAYGWRWPLNPPIAPLGRSFDEPHRSCVTR